MAELKMKSALQKSFDVVNQICKEWTNTNIECETIIKSLCNRLEQYEHCVNTTSLEIPFHAICHDLINKLQHKIIEDIDEKLCEMLPKLDEYKECHSKVSQQYHNVMKIYNNNKTELNLEIMTRCNIVYPTLSQMIEYLYDIEQSLYQQYHCKKFIVEEMMLSNTITSDNLLSLWQNNEHNLIHNIKDYLCYTSQFIQEKIS
ncbi:hypothetical protein LOTGIDRAFT_232144 [Lottia gigantea]|uniref:Uncharacterized protein n=1 Tax=Lottia gigantea TaxID=225164 RepID=V4C0M9_LOTGI|nr:hypothetical protein LOTGIDRAFT_232144 [Lottia gigantea]ESO95004.1 hypothetical protein LOTGIDRAFT_232144 [Lottia gigantea]